MVMDCKTEYLLDIQRQVGFFTLHCALNHTINQGKSFKLSNFGCFQHASWSQPSSSCALTNDCSCLFHLYQFASKVIALFFISALVGRLFILPLFQIASWPSGLNLSSIWWPVGPFKTEFYSNLTQIFLFFSQVPMDFHKNYTRSFNEFSISISWVHSTLTSM